jgi:DNA processing protein
MSDGLCVLRRGEKGFPPLLEEIPDAPDILYVRGRLDPAIPAVAIVGSRRPSPYGLRAAAALARGMASKGIAVVSGLARGIDGMAHRAALDAGGATWAVLGCGLGQVYPPEHRDLAERIVAAGGCLMSELPLDAAPLAGHFPRRNRIISGLSMGCVVVEGRLKSGSLITAKLAAEQGREVFAVPGPVSSPLSQAPHWLLENGADLLTSAEDILWKIPGLAERLAARGRPDVPPAPVERPGDRLVSQGWSKILESLGSEALTLDELQEAVGSDAQPLVQHLVDMELSDLIISLPGRRYARKT